MLETSSAEDIRLRFFASLKSLGRGFAARLTQIDYDREMALVATAASGIDAGRAIVGAVRIVADPDNVAAEFGIMVRSDHQGRGLGYALMQRIIAYGRARGLERIFGYVLSENLAMLLIAKELGFTRSRSAEDPAVVCVTLELGKSRTG
jgi:acetyltransferase